MNTTDNLIIVNAIEEKAAEGESGDGTLQDNSIRLETLEANHPVSVTERAEGQFEVEIEDWNDLLLLPLLETVIPASYNGMSA